MTTEPTAGSGVPELVRRLDAAVRRGEPRRICDGVREALEAHLAGGHLVVPAHLLVSSPRRYARRLLHHSPSGDYSVLVMVWAPGQGTPIHDHAGKWCVEGVLRGEIEIESYEFHGPGGADDVVRLAPAGCERARVGDVGILVPPNEYHAVRNTGEVTAVTIHVYQGEMLWCHALTAREGGRYRRERCELAYTT